MHRPFDKPSFCIGIYYGGWLLHSRSSAFSRGEGCHEAQAIGLSRGGLTTKIHAVVDSLGNPIRLKLTGGNAHDSVPALELIGGLSADNVIADKAYDAQNIIELIQAQGSNPIIPPKKNRIEQREYDKHL